MRFSGIVFLVLLAAFIYFGALAGFWDVMRSWDWRSWAIFTGGVMLAWIGNDEFGRSG